MEKNSSKRTNPILVTGMHRSGTTWVGKMIAANSQFAYISEPLNVLHRPGVFQHDTQYWYTYINPKNEAVYLPAFTDTISFRYHLFSELQALYSIKDFFRMIRDLSTFIKGRLQNKRALIKDPFAVFSSQWFAERLNCQVVIVVRHPAAVINSMKRLGWDFDFTDLLAQNKLIKDWLSPYQEEIYQITKQKPDIIMQGSLLWKIIYATVAQYKKINLGFHIVRHEDLSRNPLESYRTLYHDLNLRFTNNVKDVILKYSDSKNPKNLSQNRTHSVRLNSSANIKNWKDSLDHWEITQIRKLTEEIASQFYSDEDW